MQCQQLIMRSESPDMWHPVQRCVGHVNAWRAGVTVTALLMSPSAGVKELTARLHPTLEHIHACLPLHVACGARCKTEAAVLTEPFRLAVFVAFRGKVVRRETLRVEGAEARPVALQQLPTVPTHVAVVAVQVHPAAMLGRQSLYYCVFSCGLPAAACLPAWAVSACLPGETSAIFAARWPTTTSLDAITPLVAWIKLLIIAVGFRVI
eukprot:4703-Prorocentrum_minimum.AAC.3